MDKWTNCFEHTPDDTTVDAIPDLTLEDGDQFYVPSVPPVVTVIGDVYSLGSFLLACFGILVWEAIRRKQQDPNEGAPIAQLQQYLRKSI